MIPKKHLLLIVTLITILMNQKIVLAQQEEDLSKYVWDLSSLFAGENEWEAEREIIQKKIEEIEKYRGTLGKGAGSLADAMDAVYDLRSRASKMYMYGILNYEANVNSEQALLQYDIGTAFESKVESAVAFIKGEIKNIGPAKVTEWIKTEPRLQKHKRRLNRILFEAPYTLENKAQELIQSMDRWHRLPIDIYDNLMYEDLGWTVLEDNSGNKITADPGSYGSALRSSDNPDQQKIINAYLSKLKSMQDVFGLLFTRRIEADLTIAKHRGFESGMDALWYLWDGMPVGCQELAVEVAQSNLPILNKYLKLRGQILGVDKLSFPDLFTRVKFDKKFTVKETEENFIEASKIFGEEYQKKLKERVKKPWMHLAPTEGKSGTYAIFPAINHGSPYIIMTYNGTLTSSRALAGAYGLMMAFADISEVNPYDTRDDPGIFSNSMIYVANMLYYDYLKNNTTNIDEKIVYILGELDLLTARMFRYPMMAEFEKRIENSIIQNDNPTGGTVSKIYLETLKKYYGINPDIMNIDEIYAYDWITNGILFLSYEDQFWYGAAGAAAAIYEKLLAGDEQIINFFNSGYGIDESDRSYQMFLNAGIDLSTKEPYEKLAKRIDFLCSELESLLRQK